MNKTDRMLAIILELQGKGRQRAEDLAATFETSVRTIYRDMQALSEAGVPIIGSPGQGYSLSEGYFLPPVSFTAEEAVTMLLGLEFIEQQFDEDYRERAGIARKKIEAVLDKKVKNEADRTRAGMRLLTSRSHTNQLQTLVMVRKAISDNKQVRFCYTKNITRFDTIERTTRTVNPYGLVFKDGNWLLIAYCHLRQAMRHFLLSRMESLELLEDSFPFPVDFQLNDYIFPDHRDVVVRLMVQSHLTLRIKENGYYFLETIEETNNCAILTLRVRQLEEIIPWVLSWGSQATVLEPESLIQHVKQEAEKIVKRY